MRPALRYLLDNGPWTRWTVKRIPFGTSPGAGSSRPPPRQGEVLLTTDLVSKIILTSEAQDNGLLLPVGLAWACKKRAYDVLSSPTDLPPVEDPTAPAPAQPDPWAKWYGERAEEATRYVLQALEVAENRDIANWIRCVRRTRAKGRRIDLPGEAERAFGVLADDALEMLARLEPGLIAGLNFQIRSLRIGSESPGQISVDTGLLRLQVLRDQALRAAGSNFAAPESAAGLTL